MVNNLLTPENAKNRPVYSFINIFVQNLLIQTLFKKLHAVLQLVYE